MRTNNLLKYLGKFYKTNFTRCLSYLFALQKNLNLLYYFQVCDEEIYNIY